MIPGAWAGIVMALGVYRICRLIGWDDLPPVVHVRARMTGEVVYHDATSSKEPIRRYDRPLLEHFITCPFCLGFWISVAAYVAWVFEPRWTLYFLAPWALAAAVGLISKNLDP